MTNRRTFIKITAGAALSTVAFPKVFGASKSNSFFKLNKVKGRWFFLDPQGKPFFSLALNHIDSATLRYLENDDIWHEMYGNSLIRWIKESVRPSLKNWGFNSVGWVQEVTVKQQAHSRNWSFEEWPWICLTSICCRLSKRTPGIRGIRTLT